MDFFQIPRNISTFGSWKKCSHDQRYQILKLIFSNDNSETNQPEEFAEHAEFEETIESITSKIKDIKLVWNENDDHEQTVRDYVKKISKVAFVYYFTEKKHKRDIYS